MRQRSSPYDASPSCIGWSFQKHTANLLICKNKFYRIPIDYSEWKCPQVNPRRFEITRHRVNEVFDVIVPCTSQRTYIICILFNFLLLISMAQCRILKTEIPQTNFHTIRINALHVLTNFSISLRSLMLELRRVSFAYTYLQPLTRCKLRETWRNF